MKKEKQKIEVEVKFTEGWQERFTKAAYELYLEVEDEKHKKEIENKINE
jgi:hypothetical protein